jgi:hypothetical protein
MAFWEAERQRLSGLGVTPAQTAARKKAADRAKAQAAQTEALSTAPTIASTTGGIDPNAVVASIPASAKKPTDVVLPPPSKIKTQDFLTKVNQNIAQAKVVTAQTKRAVDQVASTRSSLKGFFGFGAADVTKQQKVQATQQNKGAADKAKVDAKQAVAVLQQNKAALAQHRADLLKDKAQITNENTKLKSNIAQKTREKGRLNTSLAAIPKTITESKQVQTN